MKSFITDISVALIFFNRPDYLSQTFEAISRARPSRLYLIQDGPRNENDEYNIHLCRNIVSKIDWDCEVTKIYSDNNLGCGERVYSGLCKVFGKEDFTVIIEDDIVISEDFLPFCKELAEKYKEDDRIGIISGMNHIGVYENPSSSYFFSRNGGAIWGWGTWRRVWEKIDWELECRNESYLKQVFAQSIVPYQVGKNLLSKLEKKYKSIHNNEKQTSWSFQFGFTACYLQNRLNIVPKVNLIKNIGFVGEHSGQIANSHNKSLRLIYNAPVYRIDFPLSHPKYIIDDTIYAKRQAKVMRTGILRRVWNKLNREYHKFVK